MFRILSAVIALVVITLATAGIARAGDDYDGPPRWESTTVTITPDLERAAGQWGEAVTFRVVDEGAQISTHDTVLDDNVGGEAQRTFTGGNYLDTCRIAVDADTTDAILTHELGHCLGLGHTSVGPTNMHWWAGDHQGGWSETVTDGDRERLADLYA